MRPRYEFAFHTVGRSAGALEVDPTLALMGSLGWELRSVVLDRDGALIAALQRPLDEAAPLPDEATISASLREPLLAPAEDAA